MSRFADFPLKDDANSNAIDQKIEYEECLEFLFGRLNYERVGMPRKGSGDLRLGRMRRFLRELGDPQEAFKIVHVAGTKGKGSTSAMLAAALAAGGFKTGLFCSPHLERLEERFTFNGEAAEPSDLIELTRAVRPTVERLDVESSRPPLTFFEITAAMGLIHFSKKQADIVVLEVGMGGRLDSTNAVRPILSLITTISFDHTRQLGSTLRAIAAEKAGIIKRGRPALSGVRDPEAREAIALAARRVRAPLRTIDDDFQYTYLPPEYPLTRPTPGRVRVQTWRTDWGEFDLPLLGPHQAHNAALVLASLDALAEQGILIDSASVRRGFANLRWPARVEVFGNGPWLVIDGAHNVASAQALAETLRVCFPKTSRTLIFGTSRDKDLVGQLHALLPLFDHVIVTRYVLNPRSVPPEDIADCVTSLGYSSPGIADHPEIALSLARDASSPNPLVCVTGSLFLAAEMRAVVLKKSGENP